LVKRSDNITDSSSYLFKKAMRILYFILFAALWLIGSGKQAYGQTAQTDSTRVVRLELQDGSVLFGHVLSETDGRLVLRFAHGEILRIPQNLILRKESITQTSTGKLIESDPNQTRLLFAPTARPVPKGDAYIANYYLFLNFVGYGVTEHFTMAGGFSMLPGAGIANQAFYIAPKYTLLLQEKQQLGVGLWAGAAGLSESSKMMGGIPYLNYTRGSSQKSLTFAVGLPVYRRNEYDYDPVNQIAIEKHVWRAGKNVITVLGGEHQIGRKTKLVAETWMFWGKDTPKPPENLFVAPALRYYNQNFALDFGMLYVGPSSDIIAIPYLDVVYHFRKKH